MPDHFLWRMGLRACLLGLILLQICISDVDACFGKKQPTREDCKDLEDVNGQCSDVYKGRMQVTSLTVDLYKIVSEDPTVDQANLLLIPLEVAKVIGMLVEGTGHDNSTESRLQEKRCYINKTMAEFRKTILIPSHYEKTVEKVEESKNETKTKFAAFNRHVYIDDSFVSNATFSKMAFCWYELPMTSMAFDDNEKLVREVNNWGKDVVLEAKKSVGRLDEITPDEIHSIHPLAVHPQLIEKDKVILVGSSFLKLHWKPGLFNKDDTKMDQPFLVSKTDDKGESNLAIKIPMMTTKGKFKVHQATFYTAVSLPLDPDYVEHGSVIVILPNPDVAFETVEDQVFASGTRLFDLVRKMMSSLTPKKSVDIKLPRLNLQTIHEWGSDKDKKLVHIVADDDGDPLDGNYVGVYMDSHLEMVENSANNFTYHDISSKNKDDILDFNVNRPFLIIIQVGQEILAMGRIKDPHWCKACPNKGDYVRVTQPPQTAVPSIKHASSTISGSTSQKPEGLDYSYQDEDEDLLKDLDEVTATTTTTTSTTTTTLTTTAKAIGLIDANKRHLIGHTVAGHGFLGKLKNLKHHPSIHTIPKPSRVKQAKKVGKMADKIDQSLVKKLENLHIHKMPV